MTTPPPDPAAFVHQWLPYTFAAAYRAARRYPHLADDLVSDCLLALWTAARRFDPARGDFLPYLASHVRGAVRGRLAAGRRDRLRSVDAGEDGDDPLALVEAAGPPVGAGIEAADLLAHLDPDVRAMAELKLTDGATFEEIGTAHGTTGENVRQRLDRALGKLREAAGG